MTLLFLLWRMWTENTWAATSAADKSLQSVNRAYAPIDDGERWQSRWNWMHRHKHEWENLFVRDLWYTYGAVYRSNRHPIRPIAAQYELELEKVRTIVLRSPTIPVASRIDCCLHAKTRHRPNVWMFACHQYCNRSIQSIMKLRTIQISNVIGTRQRCANKIWCARLRITIDCMLHVYILIQLSAGARNKRPPIKLISFVGMWIVWLVENGERRDSVCVCVCARSHSHVTHELIRIGHVALSPFDWKSDRNEMECARIAAIVSTRLHLDDLRVAASSSHIIVLFTLVVIPHMSWFLCHFSRLLQCNCAIGVGRACYRTRALNTPITMNIFEQLFADRKYINKYEIRNGTTARNTHPQLYLYFNCAMVISSSPSPLPPLPSSHSASTRRNQMDIIWEYFLTRIWLYLHRAMCLHTHCRVGTLCCRSLYLRTFCIFVGSFHIFFFHFFSFHRRRRRHRRRWSYLFINYVVME